MSNNGRSADSKASLEEILQVALSHTLLSQADIRQVMGSLGESQEVVTPQLFARQAIQLGKLTVFQAKILLSKEPNSLSIGPYLILDKIGQGGMGSVYKACHKSMDRIVALKILRRRDGFSQETVQRFQREVFAAAKLIHPNIVTAFDAGEQSGLHYLVMEYVSGVDLKTLIDQQGPLSVARAIEYVQQVARGMQYAHDKQIIHRDIKPANLLLDSEGSVKILDLGLARIIREKSQEESQTKGLTADGSLMGTVDYLSPEQSLDTKTADERSDIYSLGCTLYTLLTGEAVYPAGTLVQKIIAHRESPIPSLRLKRIDVPESLDGLFRQMLSKVPADRPQSMAAVFDGLKSIVSGGNNSDVYSGTSTVSKSTEDSFLETLIMGSQVTVNEQVARASQAVSLSSLPISPVVRPVTLKRKKTKRIGTNVWFSAAILMGLLVALGLTAWAILSSGGSVDEKLALEKPPSEMRGASSEIPARPKNDPRKNESPSEPIPPVKPMENKSDTGEKSDVVAEAPGMPTPDVPVASAASEMPVQMNNKETPFASSESQKLPSKTPEVLEPSTLVVGVGTGEIPDLATAIQQAKPNDTILIRHRGPLELSPMDLTGKSPLTIQGGEQGGVEYWPIIRQRAFSGDALSSVLTQDEGSAKPLFHGDRVEIQFKNLHLACGGYGRERLSSFLRCNSGKISFEKCTFTASTDEADKFAEGLPLPLIELTGSGEDHLELRFSETLVRGSRLKSLVRISSEAKVSVAAENWLWAGGQGALFELGAKSSSGNLKLKNSTIYNFSSLVSLPVYRLLSNDRDVLFDLELEDSILAAREKGASSLVTINGEEKPSLDNNRWKNLFRLRIKNSTLANIDDWLPSTDRIKSLSELSRLFEIEGKNNVTDSVPRFHVFPAGTELQEVLASDLEVSENKTSKRSGSTKTFQGISASELPIALARISERMPVGSVLAGKPRGLPRILEVAQKGPLKSLEEAFNQIQGEDVEIVITDSETYVPSRNFDVDQRTGVLYTEVADHLTIRAAPGAKPTLVISDSPQNQKGVVPRLAHWDGKAPQLFLFSTRAQSLSFDGLQFVADIRSMRHSIFLTTAQNVRMTNCGFKDRSSHGPAYFFGSNGYGVAITSGPEIGSENCLNGPNIRWIENVIIDHPVPASDSVPEHFVQLATAFSFQSNKGSSHHIVFRNCAIGFNHVLFHNMNTVPWVDVESCTLWGRLVSSSSPMKSIKVRDNIIFANTNPVIVNPPGLVESTVVGVGNNALWIGDAPIPPQVRNQGGLRWMPGISLNKPPVVDGESLKLKGKLQPSITAEDGGNVGFRSERLN